MVVENFYDKIFAKECAGCEDRYLYRFHPKRHRYRETEPPCPVFSARSDIKAFIIYFSYFGNTCSSFSHDLKVAKIFKSIESIEPLSAKYVLLLYVQQRLTLARASIRSDQGMHYQLPWLTMERITKTQITPGRRPAWVEIPHC